MIEYAAPLMAYVEDGTVADPNDALQVGVLLWNSTLPAVPVPMRQSRGEIVGVSHLLHMEFFTGLCGSIMPTMIRAPHTVTLTPPAEAVCRLP